MNNYPQQWQTLQTALGKQRMPHASLLVGPLHCHLNEFVLEVAALLLCANSPDEPCHQCSDCQMVARGEHPDLTWIKPEKDEGSIKIDQIRAVQHSAYLSAQRSTWRLIVIEAADRMNTAAANALLKVLEEPKQKMVFILLAQNLSSMLPTVISRCQMMPFYLPEEMSLANWLFLGEYYAEDTERRELMAQREKMLNELIAVWEHKEHPCVIAAQWTRFQLSNLLWFLYLVYAQLLRLHFYQEERAIEPQLNRLQLLAKPVIIFNQLDKINGLLIKLSHNITINPLLAVEELLLVE